MTYDYLPKIFIEVFRLSKIDDAYQMPTILSKAAYPTVQVFSNLFKWIYRQIYRCSSRGKIGELYHFLEVNQNNHRYHAEYIQPSSGTIRNKSTQIMLNKSTIQPLSRCANPFGIIRNNSTPVVLSKSTGIVQNTSTPAMLRKTTSVMQTNQLLSSIMQNSE